MATGVFVVIVVNDYSVFFFFNDTATTEIYTLSLHDALPISTAAARIPTACDRRPWRSGGTAMSELQGRKGLSSQDRKSTRLNSSHSQISYAVFCLKKKKPHTRGAQFSALTPPRTPQRAPADP